MCSLPDIPALVAGVSERFEHPGGAPMFSGAQPETLAPSARGLARRQFSTVIGLATRGIMMIELCSVIALTEK